MAIIDNLVVDYALDEASGNALDSHGSHTATETSGTIAATTGKVSGCRDFELGDTEHFEVADHADFEWGNGDGYGCAWVMLESKTSGTTVMPICSKWVAGTNQREWQISYTGATTDRLMLRASHNGSAQTDVLADNFGSPPTATWMFVEWWHDAAADTINIAVNGGTPNSAAFNAAGIFESSSPFIIGAHGDLNRHWDGLIDELRLWKGRIPSSDERAWLYNSGNGRSYAEIVAGMGGGFQVAWAARSNIVLCGGLAA